MKRVVFTLGLSLALGIAVAMFGAQILDAQLKPVIEPIATNENPAPGLSKIKTVRVTFAPGAGMVVNPGKPRTAICYVLEGAIQLKMGGKTTTYGPGTSFVVPKGAAHSATNIGTVKNVQLIQLIWHP